MQNFKVHFHKNNWPSLHKYVTPDILPQEYGGKLTTLDYADLRCYLTDNEKRLNGNKYELFDFDLNSFA